eukprot:13592912-Ditylum_brightwellii.AAC.1
MAAPALTSDQISAIAAAAIQAVGLLPGEKTFSDNPFADKINPATKNAVPTEKQIATETKNLQKLLDFLENQNTRYQWISLTKQIPDKASTDLPSNWDVLKQYGLLSLEAMKRHANRYFGDDALSDDVSASDLMDIADITPSMDNNHKRIFFKQ